MDDEVGKKYKALGEQSRMKIADGEGKGEGNISCISLRNKRKKPSMEAIMAQINGGGGQPEAEYEQEVFVGYESGAIGMFKVELADKQGGGYKIEIAVLISP